MKHLFFVMAMITILTGCCTTGKSPSNINSPSLQQVVEAVQHQYTKALETLNKRGITNVTIKGAELSLGITKTISAGGTINVLIFKPSGKYTRTKATSITYVLSDKKDTKGGTPLISLINDDLSDMIVSAATELNQLNSTIGDLVRNSFEINLVFSIDKTAGGGLEFNILGMSIGAEAEAGHSMEHGLKLTFEYK